MAMNEIQVATSSDRTESRVAVPVSVIVATRNEARNLPRCLDSLCDVGEVYIIDSQSTDATIEVARSHGAKAVQFHYAGGWPKKRQWAMDTLQFSHDWILLLDADEALSAESKAEIRRVVAEPEFDGYYLTLQMRFLGRVLRHSGASFRKLALFRKGRGRFECRLRDQDISMCDMEVHEHVIVDGACGKLKNPILHYNIESLSRYIRKHDEYSNWDAKVWLQGDADGGELPASLSGTQAQRRRWLRQKLFEVPGSPALFFIYKYIFCLGFLDGIPGLIYCAFQGIQFFHIKAKIYELRCERSAG